jgi:CRAL/TRIO domain
MEKIDDDFQDAVDGDDEGIVGDFSVTDEEIALLRAAMASDYPEDCLYLSEAYIRSVANKPYSKDPTVRRPLEYSQEKLLNVLKWRDENGAPTMEALMQLACEDSSSAAAIEDPERYTLAVALAKALNNASIYFHGFTKEGRPILWVRTNRKPWYPDVDAECNALILIADAGIKAMPDGVTDFVVVAESSYPPPPNPNFMIKLLQALVRGYPDRLKILYSAPVSSIVQFVVNLLLPLMPGRLASKVCLLTTSDVKENLKKIMEEEDIPDFFGGPSNHDTFYPEEGKSTVKKGNLKFDYNGMVERLQVAKEAYMKKQG